MLVQENLTGLGVIEQWGKLVSRVGGGEREEKKGTKRRKGGGGGDQLRILYLGAIEKLRLTFPPSLPLSLLSTSQSRATSTPSVMAVAFSKRFPKPQNFIASDRRPYNYNAAPTLPSTPLFQSDGGRERGREGGKATQARAE